MAQYKRVLLKLSGEALAGGVGFGLDIQTVQSICKGIANAHETGVQMSVVVGGGNFWRGRSGGDMERTKSDHIGMLATVMNALAVADALEKLGIEVRVQTAIPMQAVAEPYVRNKAVRHMEKGRIVIMACGTGNPFFSTDTAAALRAAEIGADMVLKATLVDGVYDSDPKKNPNAVKYETLGFDEMLEKRLAVLDTAAAALCRENGLPLFVFDLSDPENIRRAVQGEAIGTLVKE